MSPEYWTEVASGFEAERASTFEPAGNPMDAHPGRRKLSGDVPLFVVDERGRPVVAVGTPGGHTIAQTIPQIVMNVLDFGMDIQAAIAAPRVSFVEPDVLAVEEAVPEGVRWPSRAAPIPGVRGWRRVASAPARRPGSPAPRCRR